MGHLVNGNGRIGDGSRKRIFENGGFSDGPVLKFKKRRVSAIRDFPPGCGRNALPINGRLKENGCGEGLD
ncbi:[histone H3]-lysine(4) N-trimethyltransferase [Ranunculus cassubicifolius]